jgi:hypothetical protein
MHDSSLNKIFDARNDILNKVLDARNDILNKVLDALKKLRQNQARAHAELALYERYEKRLLKAMKSEEWWRLRGLLTEQEIQTLQQQTGASA